MSGLQLTRLGDDPGSPFPPTHTALSSPQGLLAWGGDLDPRRLLSAYRQGIFPWFSPGEPILWWSPAPRCVIFPDAVHLSKRTRQRYNAGHFAVTSDRSFRKVIAACAEPRKGQNGTWISPEMQFAYAQLHESGHAHSVEVWKSGSLAGGIYGLALGRIFFGESMFSRETDASKIALIALCRQLVQWNFALLDCQVPNPHLLSLGARTLTREAFEEHLKHGLAQQGETGSWSSRFQTAQRW